MTQTHKTPRKKVPKRLAVIDPDSCTGCEACIEVCPVDCIELHTIGQGIKSVQSWCEVDLNRCIGCELCVRIPRKKSDPYEMLVCPWDAIEMLPQQQLSQSAGAADRSQTASVCCAESSRVPAREN